MTAANAERLVDDEAARRAGGIPVSVNGETGVYSLARGLTGGGFEREVSEELEGALEDRILTRGGLMVPPEAMFPRAELDSATATEGGEFVFEDQPELVPARRPVPRVEALGATVVRGGQKTLTVVRVTDGGSVTWHPEVPGSPISDDDMTLGSESVDLKQGMLSTAYSRRLRSINRETAPFIEQEIRAAAATAVDEGAVAGGGGDAPTGLLNRGDTPVHSIADPDGGDPTYTDIVAMEEAPAAADVDELAPGWLSTPGVRRNLRETAVMGNVAAGPTWRGGRIVGRRAEVSSVVPSDLTKGAGTGLHALLFSGDWSNLVVHILAVEVVTDPFTEKDQGLIETTLFLHVGVGVRHPEAFIVATDASV